MSEPIWWIWLASFCRSLFRGCDYFMLRRGNVRDAWFVAGVVARACRKIRMEP